MSDCESAATPSEAGPRDRPPKPAPSTDSRSPFRIPGATRGSPSLQTRPAGRLPVRSGLRPLTRIEETAAAIAHGDFSSRVPALAGPRTRHDCGRSSPTWSATR
ncbi:HAMP domain-containing protein [Streptomyces yaizuensis]|uniref:HAMP domain-containing protein n=1 Tax=Streptomyces yaizuensis TaxID=2989713 RepID=UPI00389AD7E1